MSALCIALFFAACQSGTNTEQTETKQESDSPEKSMNEAGATGSYTLSQNESMLAWKGNMLAIGGVSLYGHNGTIDFEKGMLTLENGKIVDGTFVVSMSTITPTDEAYNPEEGSTREKLVGHLSSPDFFAVDSFPTATFEVTGMQDDKIMGDLTIRGVTNAESIEGVAIETMDGKVKATGKMTIDRQKYGVAFSMGAEDKILSDDISFEFTIMASSGESM